MHSVTVKAFEQRSLLQYKPRKLYYAVFPEREVAGEEIRLPETRVSAEFITTRIDCSQYLGAAGRAVECHWLQFAPEMMARVHRFAGIEGGHPLAARLQHGAGLQHRGSSRRDRD